MCGMCAGSCVYFQVYFSFEWNFKDVQENRGAKYWHKMLNQMVHFINYSSILSADLYMYKNIFIIIDVSHSCAQVQNIHPPKYMHTHKICRNKNSTRPYFWLDFYGNHCQKCKDTDFTLFGNVIYIQCYTYLMFYYGSLWRLKLWLK